VSYIFSLTHGRLRVHPLRALWAVRVVPERTYVKILSLIYFKMLKIQNKSNAKLAGQIVAIKFLLTSIFRPSSIDQSRFSGYG